LSNGTLWSNKSGSTKERTQTIANYVLQGCAGSDRAQIRQLANNNISIPLQSLSHPRRPLSIPVNLPTSPGGLRDVYGSHRITDTNTNVSFLTDMFIYIHIVTMAATFLSKSGQSVYILRVDSLLLTKKIPGPPKRFSGTLS